MKSSALSNEDPERRAERLRLLRDRRSGLIKSAQVMLEKLAITAGSTASVTFIAAGKEVTVHSETLVVGKEKEEVVAWLLDGHSLNRLHYYLAHSPDKSGLPRFITKMTWRHPKAQWRHHSDMDLVEANVLHGLVKQYLYEPERKADAISEDASSATAAG
jgi:hypothetical protein